MARSCSRVLLWNLNRTTGKIVNKKTKATLVTAFPGTAPVTPVLSNARPFEDIPSPKQLPILGTLHHYFPGGNFYGKSASEVMLELYEGYGNLVKLQFTSGITILHMYDADDIETLFRQEGRYPIRRSSFMLEYYNRKSNNNVNGLLTCHKQEWHRLRKHLQQKMLRPKTVSAYLPGQSEVADDFLDRVSELRDVNGEVADLRQDIYRFAADSIGVVCFNKRIGALKDLSEQSEANQFFLAVKSLMEVIGSEYTSVPFYRLFRTPKYRRLEKNMGFIQKLSEKYTDQAVTDTQSRLDRGEMMDGDKGDLIPYLLTKTDLSRQDVLTVISEFIFAGVETTSHALGFALYLLSKNPSKQRKLEEEIGRVLPDNAPVTEATFPNMPYLRAVIKESLRCIPVLAGTVRTLQKDMMFSGYRVPAGTTVCPVNLVVCKLEKYYNNPENFEPERWLRNENTAPINPFAYTPFGFGTRSCIGKRFAEQVISLALVKILQKYNVEFLPDELKLFHATTYRPVTPLNFRFTVKC